MNKEIDNHSIINDFGYFWFPEKPNERISGTIKRDKFNQKFLIHLLMQKTEFGFLLQMNKHFDILYGELSSIGAITLKSLRVTSTSNNGNYELEAEFFFTNIHLIDEKSDNCFENISTKVFFDGLSNWKFHNNKDIILKDNQNPEIKLLNQEVKSYSILYKDYKIDFAIVFILHNKSISDLDILDYSYIEFQFEKITFEDLMAFFKDFKDLLTVLWGFPAIIKSIEFELINENHLFNLLIKQYILKENFSIKSNENYFPLMLKDIENTFEIIVNKWFELKHSNKMIIDILMEQYYNPFISLNNDFLALCRAIEAFYRPKCDKHNSIISKQKWSTLKNNIKKMFENDKINLENFIIFTENSLYKNKNTFKDILNKIKENIDSVISEQLKFTDRTIEKIVKCRNELTHESDNSNRNETLILYAIVKLVFTTIILIDLQVSDDLVKKALSKDIFVNLIK